MPDSRVLIVADNFLARTGLSALLSPQPNVTVVGQVNGGESLSDDIDVYRPDVLVWDLGWTPKPSVERLSALIEETSSPQYLPVLALVPDETHAAEVAALIAIAGVGGVLLRDSDSQTLVNALPAVACRLVVIDPALAQAVLPSGEAAPEPPSESLTPRERDVLRLLAEGLPNKSIAQRLNISDHTVKFHVNAIMGKLNAQSRTEAVVRASRLNLITL
jgi:DNA-binding NarL/FixJ family response regulator